MLVMFFVIPSLLFASDLMVGKGNHQVSPSLTIGRHFGNTSAVVQLGYGYFVTDWLKPEASLAAIITDSADVEIFQIGANVYYNRGNRIIPYTGLNLGGGWGGIDGLGRASSFIIGPKFGVLVPINETVSFETFFSYQFWNNGNLGSKHHLALPIGLSIFF